MQFQIVNSVFTLTVTATQTEIKWVQNPIGVVPVSVQCEHFHTIPY